MINIFWTRISGCIHSQRHHFLLQQYCILNSTGSLKKASIALQELHSYFQELGKSIVQSLRVRDRWHPAKSPLFSCQSSSIPTCGTDPMSESFMIHHSERLMQQCERIWSDNLQLPYTSKLEVIWDQPTTNFLVYNLKLPCVQPPTSLCTTSNFFI